MSSLPEGYAADKLPVLTRRAHGALGSALLEFLPTAWPGVPYEAFVGFTSISEGPEEDTVTPTNTQRFHELGYFQTPAGPRDGPAPNPAPDAYMSAWARHATSAYVVGLLRRPATMLPGAWKTDVRAQTAVGLADLRANALAVFNGAPDVAPALNPMVRVPASTWGVALAFMGFSAGPAKAARWLHTRDYYAQLAAVPEGERWSAWGDMIAADIAAGVTWEKGRHANPGASYLRTWQKLECGRALAEALGDASYAAWYDAPRADPAAMARGSWNVA